MVNCFTAHFMYKFSFPSPQTEKFASPPDAFARKKALPSP